MKHWQNPVRYLVLFGLVLSASALASTPGDDTMAVGVVRERRTEIRRVPLSDKEIGELERAGKTSQIDYVSRERVFEHIQDRAIVRQLSFYERLKALRAEAEGYLYVPTVYDPAVLVLTESLGGSIDDLLSIEANRGITTKATPSGCYEKTFFSTGLDALSGATTIWSRSNDDDAEADVPIGFEFYTYSCDAPLDSPSTSVRVSTNGYLTFFQQGPGAQDGTNPDNVAIPNGSLEPHGFIAPSWDDSFISGQLFTSDRVTYKTVGAIGGRAFTVEWANVSHVGATGNDTHFFQVLLFEASGAVELRYGDWTASGPDGATLGLEKLSGLEGDFGPNPGASNVGLPPNNYRFEPFRPANNEPARALCFAADVTPTLGNILRAV